jgi:hypothetical protein
LLEQKLVALGKTGLQPLLEFSDGVLEIGQFGCPVNSSTPSPEGNA